MWSFFFNSYNLRLWDILSIHDRSGRQKASFRRDYTWLNALLSASWNSSWFLNKALYNLIFPWLHKWCHFSCLRAQEKIEMPWITQERVPSSPTLLKLLLLLDSGWGGHICGDFASVSLLQEISLKRIASWNWYMLIVNILNNTESEERVKGKVAQSCPTLCDPIDCM